jgi:hypothetical protein
VAKRRNLRKSSIKDETEKTEKTQNTSLARSKVLRKLSEAFQE